MRRKKMNRKNDKKVFRKTAKRKNNKNRSIMTRAGYRI